MDKRMIILCGVASLLGISGISAIAVYTLKDNGKKENKQNNTLASKNSIAIKDGKKDDIKDDKKGKKDLEVVSLKKPFNNLDAVIKPVTLSFKEQIINEIKTLSKDDLNFDQAKVINLFEDVLVNLKKRLESTPDADVKIKDLEKWIFKEISSYNAFKNTISLQNENSPEKIKIVAEKDQFKKWLVTNLDSYVPSKSEEIKPLDDVKAEESVPLLSGLKNIAVNLINTLTFNMSSLYPSNSKSLDLVKVIVDWLVVKMNADNLAQKGDSKVSNEGDSKVSNEGDSKVSNEGGSEVSNEGDSKVSNEGDSKVSNEGGSEGEKSKPKENVTESSTENYNQSSKVGAKTIIK
ncbi:hypothetical protein NGRA_2340 [Nosema granulosis]|uniref:Uncharacterized protein n=1 Tax=Nosema granulosis TaxID=83296 RepID=A0A9P6H025_9MICR|nr:hypothetical protein NGRA_2340 [Nosema granulosis]